MKVQLCRGNRLGWFDRLKGEVQDLNGILSGLPQSGKTRLVMCNGRTTPMGGNPRIGNLNLVECPAKGDKMRPLIRHYYSGCVALLWVVDASTSPEELSLSGQSLHAMLNEDQVMAGMDFPVLVLVIRLDDPSASTLEQVETHFELEALDQGLTPKELACGSYRIRFQGCTGETSNEAREGFLWLTQLLPGFQPPTEPEVVGGAV